MKSSLIGHRWALIATRIKTYSLFCRKKAQETQEIITFDFPFALFAPLCGYPVHCL
jgi:hypothetical protein